MGTEDPQLDLTDVRAGALAPGRTRDELVDEVARVCWAHLPRGATALLAVSGGPDSTALAYLVAEARPDAVLFVAHVRHGLRDDRADAAVAADHAAALGLGYLERAVTVATEGRGLEDAARRARYGALAQLAGQVGARVVLVGHTADDQAETLLLNLARGTGVRGLAGMAEAAPLPGSGDDGLIVVRPLLHLRRADIREFVAGEGLEAVHDPTNRDPTQRRAMVRAELLPALARLSGGPGDPVGVLTRLTDLARADADALDDMAEAELTRMGRRWGPVWCLPEAGLGAVPEALASRVVRAVLARVRGTTEGLTAEAVASVRALAPGEAQHVAGGAWVTMGGGWLAFCPPDLEPLAPRPLAVPGTTALVEIEAAVCSDLPWGQDPATATGQRRLDLELFAPPALGELQGPQADQRPGRAFPDRLAPGRTSSHRTTSGSVPGLATPAPLAPLPPGARASARGWIAVPAEALDAPLAVRARRPGDRFVLAHGRKKLQDVFTDLRVPRGIRDLVPVVVDADDEPVWVPGVAVRYWEPDRPAGGRLWLAPLDPAVLGYPLAAGGPERG